MAKMLSFLHLYMSFKIQHLSGDLIHTLHLINLFEDCSLERHGHADHQKHDIHCCDSKQKSFPERFGRHVSHLVFPLIPVFCGVVISSYLATGKTHVQLTEKKTKEVPNFNKIFERSNQAQTLEQARRGNDSSAICRREARLGLQSGRGIFGMGLRKSSTAKSTGCTYQVCSTCRFFCFCSQKEKDADS